MPEEFVNAARTGDIPPGEKKLLHIGDAWILLVNLEGTYLAVDGKCTHSSVVLSQGKIQGDYLECPLHKSVFNLRTGFVISPPALRNLAVYSIRIAGDEILIGPPVRGSDIPLQPGL